jgi:acyl-CoA synthetase (AMP-forming)/AMP-acid ligase II
MNAEPAVCLGPPVLAGAGRIERYTRQGLWGRQSLPSIFYRHADSRSDSLALSDRPGAGEDEADRDFTYSDVDLAVRHIAARFDACGLKPGDIIALQLPPGIEAVVTVLACLGHGFIVCALPISWRRLEIENALARVGARAIVTWSEAPDSDRVLTACAAAFRVSAIRYVFAFGGRSVDGTTPLRLDTGEDAERLSRAAFPLTVDANALAVITWDMVSDDGPRAVARSHNECIASGLAVVVAASLRDGATILSPYLLSGLAGIATAFVPWLITGGLLALHRPFDISAWRRQMMVYEPDLAPVPARLAGHIRAATAGIDANPPVLGLVREAGAGTGAISLAGGSERAIDILCLGDIAIFARRLDSGAGPSGSEIPVGVVEAASGGPVLLETRCAPAGETRPGGVHELEVAGAAVPSAVLPTGSGHAGFRFVAGADEFVRTGHFVRVAHGAAKTFAIAADPLVVHVGALPVRLDDLDILYAGAGGIADAAAIAVDDPIMGARLAAAVVADRGRTPCLEGLVAHLDAIGAARFKAPDRLFVVDAIARDGNGAVRRDRLRALL